MSLLVSWNLGVLSNSAAGRGQVACDLQRVGIGEICFSVSLRSIICHEPVVFTTAKCFHGPWSPVDVSGGPWFRRHNPGGPQGPQFCSRRYNTGTLGAGRWLVTRHCLEVCPSTPCGGAWWGCSEQEEWVHFPPLSPHGLLLIRKAMPNLESILKT